MSVNSKMTALADEVRELSGTTAKLGIDAMTTNVQSANTEVSDQTDLIAQISAALDGKVAGGNGAAVDTCTVTINFIASEGWEMLNWVEYATLRDGVLVHVSDDIASNLGLGNYMGGSISVTLENIVCNSFIYIDYETTSGVGATTDGDMYLSIFSSPGKTLCCAETAAGGTVTITS